MYCSLYNSQWALSLIRSVEIRPSSPEHNNLIKGENCVFVEYELFGMKFTFTIHRNYLVGSIQKVYFGLPSYPLPKEININLITFNTKSCP
jgi:hypothetical protein